ncbi:MAG: HEPN domain-containing protein [Candidatus Bathyarchaeia archaeon]
MSFNPLSEAKYRYRLAADHLARAERLFSLRDWAGTVSASQLAVENFAKSVIAVFEVPTWSHDPSNQLVGLIEKLPSGVENLVRKLSSLAREIAPDHGRASYGEPSAGLTPGDIYREEHASDALTNAKKARDIAENVLKRLEVSL